MCVMLRCCSVIARGWMADGRGFGLIAAADKFESDCSQLPIDARYFCRIQVSQVTGKFILLVGLSQFSSLSSFFLSLSLFLHTHHPHNSISHLFKKYNTTLNKMFTHFTLSIPFNVDLARMETYCFL